MKLQEINFKQLKTDLLRAYTIINGVSVISNQPNNINSIYVETESPTSIKDAIGLCKINNLDYFFKVNKTSLTYKKNSLKKSTI